MKNGFHGKKFFFSSILLLIVVTIILSNLDPFFSPKEHFEEPVDGESIPLIEENSGIIFTINKKGDQTTISYACASTEAEKQLYSTVKMNYDLTNLISENKIFVEGDETPLYWSVLSDSNSEQESSLDFSHSSEEDEYLGIGFLETEKSCEDFQNLKVELSIEESLIEQSLTQDLTTFSAISYPQSACEVIQEPSNYQGEKLYIVFVTDSGFDEFSRRYAGNRYNPFIDVDSIIKKTWINLIEKAPAYKEYPIVYMRAKFQTNLLECEEDCVSNNNIYMQAVQLCGLVGKKTRISIVHGVDESYLNGRLGYAYYNGLSSVVLAGSIFNYHKYFKTYGNPLPPSVASEWSLAELLWSVPNIMIHEFGHQMHGLDHLTCEGYAPINDPYGLCFDSVLKCQQMTGDLCYEGTSGRGEGVSLTGFSIPDQLGKFYGLYMSPFLNIQDPPSSQQGYGLTHINNVHSNSFEQKIGIRRITESSCGNGILEDREDIDTSSILPKFQYGNQQLVTSLCSQSPYSIDKELAYVYPASNFNNINIIKHLEEGNFINDLDGNSYYNYLPVDAGLITLQKNTCRLNFNECASFNLFNLGNNLYVKGPVPEKQDYYSVPPSSRIPVDCSLVDPRFIEGTQSTSFQGKMHGSQFDWGLGRHTCNPLNNANFKSSSVPQPFYFDDDVSTIYAYQKKENGVTSIVAGITDSSGNIIHKQDLPFPIGVGDLVALEAVEFDPRDWIHNYDPSNQPINSFAEFTHPITLVATFQRGVIFYRFKPNFLQGIDSQPLYSISSHLEIDRLVRLFFDPNLREIVLVYAVKSGSIDSLYQIRIPTSGTRLPVPSPNLMISDLSLHQLDGSITTSLNGETLISVNEHAYISNELVFNQQKQNVFKARNLKAESGDLQRSVVARTEVNTDIFGRYIFNLIVPQQFYGLELKRYTLTAHGLREDGVHPIIGLANLPSLYLTAPEGNIISAISSFGVVSGVPIKLDQRIAFIDEYGDTKLVKSYIPQSVSSPASLFDLAVFQKARYSQYRGNLLRPTSIQRNPMILTSAQGSDYSQLHQAILYIFDHESVTPVVLDQATTPESRYSHFTIYPTSAGTTQQNQRILQCYNTWSPFEGYPGELVDFDNSKVILMRKDYSGSNVPDTTLEILDKNGNNPSNKVILRGVNANNRVQLNPPLSSVSISGPEPLPAPIFDYALVSGTENQQWYGYLVEFNPKTFRRSSALPVVPHYIIGEEMYNVDIATGTVKSCALMHCTSMQLRFNLPESITNLKLLYAGKGVLAYASQNQLKTYIYDTKRKQLITYPKRIIYMDIKEPNNYEVIYLEGTTSVFEKLKNNEGNLQSTQRIASPIEIGSDSIIGAEIINNELFLIMEQYLTRKVVVKGDRYRFNNGQCGTVQNGGSFADYYESIEMGYLDKFTLADSRTNRLTSMQITFY